MYKVKRGRLACAAKVFELGGLAENEISTLYNSVRKELKAMCLVDKCVNVIRVFGIVKIPDNLVLVMEYASGGSLRNYLNEAERPLDKKEVLDFVYDVANGMKEIYRKGVEHRDLKAANVLLDEHHGKLIAKVCDFGLSKCEDLMTHISSTSNRGGSIKGTLAWKAPEEFDDEPFSQKSDVYSFAIVIWEMMT